MRPYLSTLFLLTILSLVSGCQSFPQDSFTSTDRAKEPMKVNTVDEVGIAISGGGIRSSAFAYGALKSLYDMGVLEKVSAISTVSGGGYTGYELYLNELRADSNSFGAATFNDVVFNERLFQNYYTANFMPVYRTLPAILPFIELTDIYEQQITYRYGYFEPDPKSTITDFSQLIEVKNFPNFIINTTLLAPLPLNYSEDIYEFTPYESGSIARGFHSYRTDAAPSTSKLIAISGAAFQSFLKQEIVDPSVLSNDELSLSDGGHSDNLGAFALIRRGVKHIIIIDGEHDPGYSFGAYVSLKQRLKYWGAKLEIADIENIIERGLQNEKRIESPMMVGNVSFNDGSESIIYYLKMANSEFVDDSYTDAMVAQGENVNAMVRRHLRDNADANGKWNSTTLRGIDIDFDSLFAHHVKEYPSILNSLKHVRFMNWFKSDTTKMHFPQYSTADQSFANNQFLAFIGLGYFSAKALSDVPRLVGD